MEPHPNSLPAIPPGLDGPPLLVHRQGHEGGLIIGSLSGRIIQPIMEQPEWAEGLSVAMLAERHEFYMSRLGRCPALNGVVAYEDLAWITVDALGNSDHTSVIEADTEYRMDAIAEAVGIVRVSDLSDQRQDDTTGELAHVLLDESHEYDHADAKAFVEGSGFAAQQRARASGGN